MANIRTCNKHNMIACVEKTAQNADFYQIIDYLTGCSINYSLLVDPDLIGPWLQQFWTTASLKVINDVPHIRAMVAGKKILISEETIRADLLFDDANGVDCFPKQVIWDTLRDIGYEGNLAQLTFSKPLFSPQWKYLVHVLLHCLSPKSTSWEQFGTNIASALVGLATNQKFNFSLMIMNGMLGHISNGTPFLMYPRVLLPSMYLLHPLDSDAVSRYHDTPFNGTAAYHESQNLKKKEEAKEGKRSIKGHVSSVKLGRNKDEGTLSEETMFKKKIQHILSFSNVKSGETEELGFGDNSRMLDSDHELKELFNDKVQAYIKDSFKDFFPMDQRKEREMLKEEKQKDSLRRKEATISEEQPSKMHKLSNRNTIDELRNYLGANINFRAFDTLWEIRISLDRQDLFHTISSVQTIMSTFPPTGFV
ncbi:hypothetical protein Tco_0888378 [Tanacetum coccineum]